VERQEIPEECGGRIQGMTRNSESPACLRGLADSPGEPVLIGQCNTGKSMKAEKVVGHKFAPEDGWTDGFDIYPAYSNRGNNNHKDTCQGGTSSQMSLLQSWRWAGERSGYRSGGKHQNPKNTTEPIDLIEGYAPYGGGN
jgi:hypothetical protein